MEYSPPQFFKHGPSPFARLTFFAVLSLALLVSDARFRYLDNVRQVVSVVIYPLQILATAPSAAYDQIREFFVTQAKLASDNSRLREQHLLDAAQLQRYHALQNENAHLRNLLNATHRLNEKAEFAEILYPSRDPFSRKIIVDKGAQHRIREGQAVLDDTGLIGQVTRVHPWLSEVTLITEKDHAVPVQVLRTGLRTLIFGSGKEGMLEIRYIPVNADIENGDVLVTSGIDGTYPSGLPVAVVATIERNAAYPFARISCTPTAGVDKHRQVLLLSLPDVAPPAPQESVYPKQGDDKSKRGK